MNFVTLGDMPCCCYGLPHVESIGGYFLSIDPCLWLAHPDQIAQEDGLGWHGIAFGPCVWGVVSQPVGLGCVTGMLLCVTSNDFNLF